MDKFLNIDYLRSLEIDPHYFGLGFIQLKLNYNGRIHFYHKALPILVDEPHDHRYDFISKILQGELCHTVYSFKEDTNGEYIKSFEDCKPGISKNQIPESVRGICKKELYTTYKSGSHYEISSDVLHSVLGVNNCITFLYRTEPRKDFAAVIRKDWVEKVCPFSEPIPVSDCWDLIEDMLPKEKMPGYHLTDIKRGEIGELSKIAEELLELIDAHEQGAKIMSHVEMSDLYGALDNYREKYHPEVSMGDLKKMYKITKRAFKNGHR